MFENIEKLIELSAQNDLYVDDNDEFKDILAVDKVNEYLKNGWKLLSIKQSSMGIESYILGFPKSNPSN